MLVWVIYDISSDKDRNKIAKTCKEYGLIRVQYSVFFGNIPMNQIDELAEYSKELIDIETDAVFLIPITEQIFENKIIIGKQFNEDFATGKQTTVVF